MKVLFWSVDCQKDFMLPTGKLYVKGAEEIVPNLVTLTKLAKWGKIRVVNTGDYHTIKSKEISQNPDFKETFPEHCIVGTEGMDFIPATYPKDFDDNYHIIDWLGKKDEDEEKEMMMLLARARNVIIYKDVFDVFQGNPHTEKILDRLDPDIVFVYGVATNVCVHFAVQGLCQRGKRVIAVSDAIKELPHAPLDEIFKDWESKGVVRASTRDVEAFVNILGKSE